MVRPLAVAVRNSDGAPFILNLFHFEFVCLIFNPSVWLRRHAKAQRRRRCRTSFGMRCLGRQNTLGSVPSAIRGGATLFSFHFHLNDCFVRLFIDPSGCGDEPKRRDDGATALALECRARGGKILLIRGEIGESPWWLPVLTFPAPHRNAPGQGPRGGEEWSTSHGEGGGQDRAPDPWQPPRMGTPH